MTTTASKRMRIAALGLSTALSVGVLAPFIGTSSASAVTCSTASSNVAHAHTKLAKDKAKLHKAKKRLRKARHARKAAHVIRHDKRVVKRAKHRVKMDRRHQAAALAAQRNCSAGGTSTGGNSSTPLNSFLSLLSGGGAGLSPAALTDALNGVADQIAASPAPGADALADALKNIADQVDANSAALDPTTFQQALTDALASVQDEIKQGLADPTSVTPQTLVDDIIDPLVDGLTTAGVPGLPDLLDQVQSALDELLGQIPGTSSLTDLFSGFGA